MSFYFFFCANMLIPNNMLREVRNQFENIWEETKQEHAKASIIDVKNFLKCCENINMGWVNLTIGKPKCISSP